MVLRVTEVPVPVGGEPSGDDLECGVRRVAFRGGRWRHETEGVDTGSPREAVARRLAQLERMDVELPPCPVGQDVRGASVPPPRMALAVAQPPALRRGDVLRRHLRLPGQLGPAVDDGDVDLAIQHVSSSENRAQTSDGSSLHETDDNPLGESLNINVHNLID